MKLRPALLPALGVFVAAARHQNFAHAADELHLTASAVSHHICKLEALLGTTLFQRHARGVKLTAEGRQLADAAGAALDDIAAVAGNLHPDPDAAPLRITTLRSLSYCWLLPRLPGFCAAHPHVRLEIQTDSAFSRFEEGGPDLGVRYGEGQWPGLQAHHLMDEELFPVASPALPQLARIQSARDIAGLPLLTDLSPQSWRDWFRAADARGVALPPMHTFNDSTDVMRAAVYGIGAALARARIAEAYLQRHELVRLPGPALKARHAYYIVYPTHRAPSPAAALFIDWLKREALDERTPMPALPAALVGLPAAKGAPPRPARGQAVRRRTPR